MGTAATRTAKEQGHKTMACTTTFRALQPFWGSCSKFHLCKNHCAKDCGHQSLLLCTNVAASPTGVLQPGEDVAPA